MTAARCSILFNRFFVGLIYANPTMMISISSPLLKVPAHHHHCLALRPHRLLQLQGPPVLQADQVSKSFRPFVKPPVTQSGSGAAGSRSQSVCFATLSLFSTLVLLMVPPSLHRAINKNQPEPSFPSHTQPKSICTLQCIERDWEHWDGEGTRFCPEVNEHSS